MKRINTRMKLLAVGLLGLGGLALAGSASAACPATPVAWTGVVELAGGSVSIATPGLGGTDCLMASSIGAGALSFSSAAVHDASPNAEPRYRASFIVDLDNLAAPGFADSVQIFSANTEAGSLRLGIFGDGTNWNLGYFIVGTTVSGSQVLSAGENHIEFDLQIGTSGSLTLWVNSNTESSPTVAAITVDNSSMVGVNDAYMGLSAPSNGFISSFTGMAAQFDQFDSRRQTFIGY